MYVAAIACGFGVLGCIGLWLRHRKNYVWVINRIFLPTFMNSLAGLISTIVNVYSAQSGQYSITARVTLIVTGSCTVVAAGLFLLYNNLALTIIKRRHRRERTAYEQDLERQNTNNEKIDEEGRKVKKGNFFVRFMRKMNKPAIEPESVV